MNKTFAAVAIMISLLALAAPALANSQMVSMGNYNITLDFGDKDVTAEPKHIDSTLQTILSTITFRGFNQTDYATVYLYDYQVPQTFDLEDRLWKVMKGACTMVEIEEATISGTRGFIGTGYARIPRGFGKQVCYGGIVALPSGAKAQRDFIILAHFYDPELNEKLVKSAQVEYAAKPKVI